MKGSKQSGLLYAYYGDDFTGSTDALEALALYGVPAVLFTHVPSAEQLKAFPECRAIGIAGESRSHTPAWMNRHLPEVFAAMRALGAPVNHYKVCSTFDSAPHTGNIGRAIEHGVHVFETEFVPVVVGAPHLGRAVAYGNLFAAAHGTMYRIDRHPTMKRHPVTPMTEADLRMHLARQTELQMGLVDMTAFQAGCAAERLKAELNTGARAVVFDGVEDAMLDETARIVWQLAQERQLFAVGSSGLSHGLMRCLRTLGLIGEAGELHAPKAVDRVLVLSGSCAPATERQIRWAKQNGFAARRLQHAETWGAQTRKALEALSRGESVVLYTALGSHTNKGHANKEYGAMFSRALGARLRELLITSGVRRVVIAGGDTASHVVKELGLEALTYAAPLTPGAPLCRGHAPSSPLDGLELVLKGGQIGPENFFAQVRDGQ